MVFSLVHCLRACTGNYMANNGAVKFARLIKFIFSKDFKTAKYKLFSIVNNLRVSLKIVFDINVPIIPLLHSALYLLVLYIYFP